MWANAGSTKQYVENMIHMRNMVKKFIVLPCLQEKVDNASINELQELMSTSFDEKFVEATCINNVSAEAIRRYVIEPRCQRSND